ncbi:hypothetical protein GDO81_023061 [Engystomops pustulosus]|uniref:Uncharacterized protein n=1 Tax=Engystomops pustulosus TaxID=76066 RepID=A0AAV6YW91_ENGPU|nr:hypothetical protein GDO81_023061 [Engystomops pustulosus]
MPQQSFCFNRETQELMRNFCSLMHLPYITFCVNQQQQQWGLQQLLPRVILTDAPTSTGCRSPAHLPCSLLCYLADSTLHGSYYLDSEA